MHSPIPMPEEMIVMFAKTAIKIWFEKKVCVISKAYFTSKSFLQHPSSAHKMDLIL